MSTDWSGAPGAPAAIRPAAGDGTPAQPRAVSRGHALAPSPDRTLEGAAAHGGRSHAQGRARYAQGAGHGQYGHVYAALDLGTNNCRLLIARPSSDGFRIVDAFSRIVRLGEGLSHTGRLGEAAIRRTIAALAVCRDKMRSRGVTRSRLIATEACRSAQNGGAFLDQVADELGIDLEIVDRETEAHLAAAGCAALADPDAKAIVLFDIGGGSTEIVWLSGGDEAPSLRERIRIWASLPMGVVTLAEKFGGHDVDDRVFEAMVSHVAQALGPFVEKAQGQGRCTRFHLLGTSGTVTTLAGVHLGLLRYDRRRIDGLWMAEAEVDEALAQLRDMSYEERAANGCIGHERAAAPTSPCSSGSTSPGPISAC